MKGENKNQKSIINIEIKKKESGKIEEKFMSSIHIQMYSL